MPVMRALRTLVGLFNALLILAFYLFFTASFIVIRRTYFVRSALWMFHCVLVCDLVGVRPRALSIVLTRRGDGGGGGGAGCGTTVLVWKRSWFSAAIYKVYNLSTYIWRFIIYKTNSISTCGSGVTRVCAFCACDWIG